MIKQRIMYVCSECAEGCPEACGHYDRTELRVMPDGAWLCESCFDNNDDNEFLSWGHLPAPEEYRRIPASAQCDRTGWQPIDTVPQTEWGKGLHLLVWTDKVVGNIFAADVHNLPGGEVWVNLGNFNGNAVEHWGVTHWRYPPAGPGAQTEGGRATHPSADSDERVFMREGSYFLTRGNKHNLRQLVGPLEVNKEGGKKWPWKAEVYGSYWFWDDEGRGNSRVRDIVGDEVHAWPCRGWPIEKSAPAIPPINDCYFDMVVRNRDQLRAALEAVDPAALTEGHTAWIDNAALQYAHEVVALPENWTYTRRKAAIHTIITRAMATAHPSTDRGTEG